MKANTRRRDRRYGMEFCEVTDEQRASAMLVFYEAYIKFKDDERDRSIVLFVAWGFFAFVGCVLCGFSLPDSIMHENSGLVFLLVAALSVVPLFYVNHWILREGLQETRDVFTNRAIQCVRFECDGNLPRECQKAIDWAITRRKESKGWDPDDPCGHLRLRPAPESSL